MKTKTKYSQNFLNDFSWYLSVRHAFSFDGQLYNTDIVYDKNGLDGRHAFHVLDSTGKMMPTQHPNILRQILKTKGSTNLHIKMYAEDRAKGYLPKVTFSDICLEYKVPAWFIKAVESQALKIRKSCS